MQDEKIKEESKQAKRSAHTGEGNVLLRLLRIAAVELLWLCGAWLLGQATMLFDTYPLGLALLCAVPHHTVSVLMGLVFTAWSNLHTPFIYIFTYIAASVVRLLSKLFLESADARFELPERLKKKLNISKDEADETLENESSQTVRGGGAWRDTLGSVFSESLRLRISTAAICTLIVGVQRIVAGGFRYYDLFAALFCLIMTPTALVVYSICLEEHSPSVALQRISAGALLFSVIYAANSVSFLTFPLSPILSLLMTLLITAMRGLPYGIGAGVICGFAYAPLEAPSYLFASLFYHFFEHKGQGSAVLSATAAAVFWSVYIGGVGKLLYILPSALIAGLAFTLFVRFLKSEKVPDEYTAAAAMDGIEASIQRYTETRRHRDSKERFRGISDAFSSLSEMFYNLSDRLRRPGTLDLRRLCDDSFDKYCEDCPNKSVCWGLEYSETLNAVNNLIAQLHTKGKVSHTQIPKQLQHRCVRMEDILSQINQECARLTGEMLRNNRTEIFAMDYEAAANIINDALEEDDGEYQFDAELEKKIEEYLKDAGVRADSVTVYGNRRRRVFIRGANIEQARITTETLRSDLGEMCGSKLGEPTFVLEQNISAMVLQAKKKISIQSAQNNVSADGGVSGDSINLFSNKKDYFYALISDGMGAGKEAAFTSNLCSVFLDKMLRAGNRAGTSLRMLNNMLRSRGADSTWECSSTIDLMEIDLMTGEASLLKSGAAPSFIIRGNVVQRLQSGTVPIGIICTLDAQETCFTLQADDMIVMVSDGILQDDSECEWLTAYLKNAWKKEPEEIVYQICLHSAEQEKHDDCSAIALRILRAED